MMRTQELLGRRVRELRKRRELTQEELAEKAGLDVKFVGSIERGTENPSVQTIQKLAHALSIKVYQIFEFDHLITGEKALRRKIGQILDACDERELQMIAKLLAAIKE
jgi:transcriptional regulator with XRE-family HTH domain